MKYEQSLFKCRYKECRVEGKFRYFITAHLKRVHGESRPFVNVPRIQKNFKILGDSMKACFGVERDYLTKNGVM